MNIGFKKLDDYATLPEYAHQGDSGMDVRSVECKVLEPFERYTFSTGLAADIPDGYELQVRPRSGMCRRGLVTMFGTVDSGYKGEIGITIINLSNEMQSVQFHDKIAQLVLSPVVRASILNVDDVGTSDRGTGGFGSTGR